MNKLIQMHYLPNLKSNALLIDSANLPDVLYTLMFNSGIVSLCTEAFVVHGKLMPKKNQAESYTLIKFADKKVLCLNFISDAYKKKVEEISSELRKKKITVDFYFLNSLGIAGTLIEANTHKLICHYCAENILLR